jgi:hypothetical protein
LLLKDKMETEQKKALKPPYINLKDEEKASLGYLNIKRVVITLRKHQKLRELFNLGSMKEAFQWFDKETTWKFFNGLDVEYMISHGQKDDDARMYALTDFLVWFINYSPNFFSEVMSYHINSSYVNQVNIELINKIFSPLGFIFKNKFFYPSSFNPEISKKVDNLLTSKLKELDEELYKTWDSITEEILSNNLDKATNISAKSRKVLGNVLRILTPNLVIKEDEQNKVRRRLDFIFAGSKEANIIDRISNLITALNQSQAKGDHHFVDEDTAIFTFQVTQLVLFLILSHIKDSSS